MLQTCSSSTRSVAGCYTKRTNLSLFGHGSSDFVEELPDYGLGGLWGPFTYAQQLDHRQAEPAFVKGQPEWQVKAIVDCKIDKERGFLYRINWKGDYEDTWEPPSHLNCDELVKAFHLRHPNKDPTRRFLFGNGIKDPRGDHAGETLGIIQGTCALLPSHMGIDST